MTEPIEILFVDDEKEVFTAFGDNIKYSLRDICGLEVSYEPVTSVEAARALLPVGQTRFRMVITDMLFPAVGGGALEDRGLEVIESTLKTPGVVVVALSQGDSQKYPRLREDTVAFGAHVFRYKGEVTGVNRTTQQSGWNDLATAMCTALGRAAAGPAGLAGPAVEPPAAREVFVVYGRDDKVVSSLFEFLEALRLVPMTWDKVIQTTIVRRGGGGNPSVMSAIQTGFEAAAGCIVLFTPDDDATLREPLRRGGDPSYEAVPTGQPRPNVLLEAGYALGWNIDRTLLVSVGRIRPVSDLAGMHIASLDNTERSRRAVAERLAAISLPVDMSGDRWKTAGDFSGPTM